MKRIMDLLFSVTALPLLLPVIFASWLIAGLETRRNGMVSTTRGGQFGKPFTSYNIRTTIPAPDGGERMSRSGKLFDALGIDVWPDIVNVIIGKMSLVGPKAKPLDEKHALRDEDKVILNLKPGLTGPASQLFRGIRRAMILGGAPGAQRAAPAGAELIRLEKNYYYHRSLVEDAKYLLRSLARCGRGAERDDLGGKIRTGRS